MKFLHYFVFYFVTKLGQSLELNVTTIIFQDLDKTNPNDLKQLEVTGINETLPGNTFTKFENLTELRLKNNQIWKIESGALCSPNLKILILDVNGNRDFPPLAKSMFGNCLKLEKLILRFDFTAPSTIDQNALEDLNLEVLGIDSLDVGNLEKNFLKLNPQKLKKLELSHIHVKKIEPNAFDDLTNLEELEIVHNLELTQLPRNLFKHLNNLNKLVLKDNKLVLSWDEFEGLVSLEKLDVFDNQINYFNASKIFKYMPKLKELNLGLNIQSCKTVNNSVKELRKLYSNITILDEYFLQFCN